MPITEIDLSLFLRRIIGYALMSILLASFPLTWYAAGSGTLNGMFDSYPSLIAVGVAIAVCPFLAYRRGVALQWDSFQSERAAKERKNNAAYLIPDVPWHVQLLQGHFGALIWIALVGFGAGLTMVSVAAF